MLRNRLLLFLFALLLFGSAKATHNRAGEITYEWISGFTYRVTITTYTKESAPADRCELDISWGDGTSNTLSRINGPLGSCSNGGGNGESLGNDFKKNIYQGTHTFPAAGIYTMGVLDPNRNGGINNIPGSINVPFYIESVLRINPQLGNNNSVVLLNPPIDDGCTQQLFLHNPSAFDADGDSLVFDLVDCRGVNGIPIPETYDPTYVQDSVEINSSTGEFRWDVPQNTGQYNFAIRITEYRLSPLGQWEFMGSVTRDMQVDIQACSNQPPVIDPVGPFCVIANQTVAFQVTASDPNGDPLILTATGGPLVVSPPASFPAQSSGIGAVSANFAWTPSCNQVRKQPYYVDFKVREVHPPTSNIPVLTAFFSAEIKVIGPKPENLQAVGGFQGISLSWNPYTCSNYTGLKIYRKKGPSGYTPGFCETGLPASAGFDLLATVGTNITAYQDTFNLEQGNAYCYRLVATFADGAESIVSDEACTELFRTAPVITRVDVDSTSTTFGEIYIEWATPKAIDSNSFPPPYTYTLYRTETGSGTFTSIAAGLAFVDTTYADNSLNTEENGYTYRVDFLAGNPAQVVASSSAATSVFLNPLGVDHGVQLKLAYSVPWTVERMAIYRETPTGSGVFDSITEVAGDSFLDTGLVNGETYCYYVVTKGAYSGNGLWQPLINKSQIACATARDTVGPCPPTLEAISNCESNELLLTWTNDTSGSCSNDIVSYSIYYKPNYDSPWPSTPQYTGIVANQFDQFIGSVVGCYAITATDDAGQDPGGQANESAFSNAICIPACPVITLPNVFSPDGSGINDNFWPVRQNGVPLVRDIELFRIRIFNRWGVLVYESNNLEDFTTKGWDGTDQTTGQPLADGVYFYVCTYTALGLEEQDQQELKGSVHLFR